MEHDVLIIGGGPAGSAAALALRKHAPHLSTLLVEASSYEKPRAGEVLPWAARGMLGHLGVLEEFLGENHPVVHSTISVWGAGLPDENHFIFSPRGSGWHLDRRKFDAFLAARARQKGVGVLLSTRVKNFAKDKKGWQVELSDDAKTSARFIIDATGRRAFFARKMGAAVRPSDNLMSFSRLFTLDEKPSPETTVEAFEHGWWYTARAGNARVVSCLTDVDIAKKLKLKDEDTWLNLLCQTGQIKASAGSGVLKGGFMTRAANSVLMSEVCGDGWLSVGEAASAFDPLSSQGIVKSLRSGIFASYAIADHLSGADLTAMARYGHFIKTEFAAYLELYKKHYSNEGRWPGSAFWQRRQN